MTKKGFVSTYFLLIFLYIVSICSLTALNDMDSIRTMMNQRTASAHFSAELQVITELKCLLLSDGDLSGEYATSQGIPFRVETEGDVLHVYVQGEYPSQIAVYLDHETRQIMDYRSYFDHGTIE